MKWVYLNRITDLFVTLDGEILDEITKQLDGRYRVRSTGKEYISHEHAKYAVDKKYKGGGDEL